MEIKRINISESHLVIDLFDKYRIFYKHPSDIQLAHDFIQARLDNNESVISVAFIQKGKERIPVCFTQLYPGYSSGRAICHWILNDLYVEKEFRHQGIGEALIKTALEFAKGTGRKFVELSTAIDNFIAQKLYEKMGFEKQVPDTEFLTYRINMN
ncbi:MAG: GNAT family N-acetyltransferase [Chitinophagaceae bacterium]